MPLTPFHFGPGFLIKSVIPKSFSFRVFIFANIIIDLEPLYFILTNQFPVHRFFHTYLGAILVGIISALIAGPICYQWTAYWNKGFKNLKINNKKITHTALISSSFVGSFSHVFLDSMMHRDMAPLSPFTSINGMLGVLSYQQIHFVCLIAGGIGLYLFLKNLRKKKARIKKIKEV